LKIKILTRENSGRKTRSDVTSERGKRKPRNFLEVKILNFQDFAARWKNEV